MHLDINTSEYIMGNKKLFEILKDESKFIVKIIGGQHLPM
jgi:hypothetical protein